MHNLDNHEEIEKASELDINNTARVILTEQGKKILRDYYLDAYKYSKLYKNDGFDNLEEWVDKVIIPYDFYESTLGEIMEIFGGHLSIVGSDKPFSNICFPEKDNHKELDINDIARVILTEQGKKILRDYYLDAYKDSKLYKNDGFDNLEEWVDKVIIPYDFYESTLGEIMEIFGGHLSIVGSDKPFSSICFPEKDNHKRTNGSGGVIRATEKHLINTII